MRWTGALIALVIITGLLTWGVIPNQAVGLTRILFCIFSLLLTTTLALRLITGR